ncbi:hypothetical protein GF325_04345 [Candidatus Bathyarchaeota archaeon]|nr:hypothetical protein [Candidatus Bathyarchaeota archaeon]
MPYPKQKEITTTDGIVNLYESCLSDPTCITRIVIKTPEVTSRSQPKTLYIMLHLDHVTSNHE